MRMGTAVGYLGKRMAQRTVNAVERKVVWGGTGAVLATIAVVFVLIAAYESLLPVLGPVGGAAALAAVCAVLGALAFFTPQILNWLERTFREQEPKPMEVIHQEAHAAVDQFGPLRVGITAFMFGLTAGRTLRGAMAARSRTSRRTAVRA